MYQLEEKLDDTIIACNSSYLAIQNVFQKDSSDTFLNIYNLQGETLLNFLERINNDPLRGDSIVFE